MDCDDNAVAVVESHRSARSNVISWLPKSDLNAHTRYFEEDDDQLLFANARLQSQNQKLSDLNFATPRPLLHTLNSTDILDYRQNVFTLTGNSRNASKKYQKMTADLNRNVRVDYSISKVPARNLSEAENEVPSDVCEDLLPYFIKSLEQKRLDEQTLKKLQELEFNGQESTGQSSSLDTQPQSSTVASNASLEINKSRNSPETSGQISNGSSPSLNPSQNVNSRHSCIEGTNLSNSEPSSGRASANDKLS